jgi:nucleoside-diphosphate-sugar epimerase
MTSSNAGLHTLNELGAEGVVADALDAHAVNTALMKARPDAVIEERTSLPKRARIGWRTIEGDTSEDQEMRAAAERDRKVRLEGGRNLYEASRAAGTKRYIVQSTGFFYGPGFGLATEEDPLASNASPAISASVATYTQIEGRVLGGDSMTGVALRYGFFYGPGTWFHKEGAVADQVRERKCPLLSSAHGVWSFVHVEDAAAATLAALDCPPGIYNVVDSDPSEMSIWLPAFAETVGASEPPQISEAEVLQKLGPDFLYYATGLRGASNSKARRELGFTPRQLEWLRRLSPSRAA